MPPVDDLWYSRRRGPDGQRLPTARHGRGKRWRVRNPGTPTRLFDRRADAERYDAAVRADLARGTFIDPAAGRERLRDYAQRWLAAQTFDPATREAVAVRLRNHVYPTLGGYELRQLAAQPSIIQAWARGLSSLSPNTVRTVFANLSAVLAAAHDDGLISRNPCRVASVRPPAATRRRVQPWPLDRVAAVRAAMPPRYAALVDLGVGLGLRQGEALGLAVEDVDFLRRTVHVRRQVKQLRGRLVFAPPKGGRDRDVPLPESVSLRLAAHIEAYPPVPVTLPWREPDGRPVGVRLVFTSRERKAVNRNYLNAHVWKPALAAAGVIPPRQPGGRYVESREHGFHVLRHTYASMMLAEGVDVRTLAEYLGHQDPGFTLRVYAHLMPSAPDKVRRAVDRMLGGLDGPPVVPELYRGGGQDA